MQIQWQVRRKHKRGKAGCEPDGHVSQAKAIKHRLVNKYSGIMSDLIAMLDVFHDRISSKGLQQVTLKTNQIRRLSKDMGSRDKLRTPVILNKLNEQEEIFFNVSD
jgi:hypothetical protein